MLALLQRFDRVLAVVPTWLSLLALRVAIAVPFFRSGLTKWDGFFHLSAGARYLFTTEFKLHLFGAELNYPFPLLSAHLAGAFEILLPILLVLGLGTRFAALGILIMTAVIQITVPEGWANFHLPWAAMALALIVFGGGRIALDRFIGWAPSASSGRPVKGAAHEAAGSV